MERLTKKIKKPVQNEYSLGSYSVYDFNNSDTNKLLNKLGQIEDFMEEYEIEDLKMAFENLTDTIKHNKFNYEELHKYKNKLVIENQALKERWQKLKEWIKGQNNPIDNLVISDDETKYLYMSDILDEMQELEKE